MNPTPGTDDKSAVVSEARRLLDEKGAASSNYDTVLGYLRAHSFGRLDSVRFLVESAAMRLLEAKRVVHDSPVWRDFQALDAGFQDSVARDLEQVEAGESPQSLRIDVPAARTERRLESD